MLVTVALFTAGILMGIGAAFVWAWGVKSGQFSNIEKTKEQLFWPEIAAPNGPSEPNGGGRGNGVRPEQTGRTA